MYSFAAPVFDIDAAPDGSILVAEGNTIKEIRKGQVGTVIGTDTEFGQPINGLETIGRRSFFATNAAVDLAEGAALYRVSQGKVRLIGDIESFEQTGMTVIVRVATSGSRPGRRTV